MLDEDQPARWQLSDREARSYILSLGRSSRRGRLWNRHFTLKRLHERLQVLREGWPPVAALNLAALCLQRWARGHRARVLIVLSTMQDGLAAGHGGRVPAASRRAAAASAHAAHAATSRRGGRRAGVPVPAADVLSSTEAGLISRFLEAKLRLAAYGLPEMDFYTWVLVRLQAWARMLPCRRYFRLARSPLLLLGAASIQYEWRARAYARRRRPRRKRRQDPDLKAALFVQRRWRSYTQRMVFRYFRDLIHFREQGDPAALLRSINPKEAGLMDAAFAAHVRFRLGGASFPPTVYYKVFTHGAVTDVCAFAPRDYTACKQASPLTLHNKERPGRQPAPREGRDGWYRRVENNGWRPVSDRTHAAKTIPWHTNHNYARWRRRPQRKDASLVHTARPFCPSPSCLAPRLSCFLSPHRRFPSHSLLARWPRPRTQVSEEHVTIPGRPSPPSPPHRQSLPHPPSPFR